jgi:hypothetical protein
VLVLPRGSGHAERKCEEIRKDGMHMHIMARRSARAAWRLTIDGRRSTLT